MTVSIMTEQQIALDLFRQLKNQPLDLAQKDLAEIAKIETAEGMILFHHTAGRHIRNEYKLWERPHAPKIVDGLMRLKIILTPSRTAS